MNDMNMDNNMNNPNEASANNPPMPQNTRIDDKAVKKMAGEAVAQVDGVLGMGGGLTNMLKSDDDMTKGISITMSSEGDQAEVQAKIITEFGKNIPNIVNEVQQKVAEALRSMAGITVTKVEVEVTDTMTRDEYQQKNNRGGSRS